MTEANTCDDGGTAVVRFSSRTDARRQRTLSSLLDLLDRPAHGALKLARRHLLFTICIASAGLVGVALATIGGNLLGAGEHWGGGVPVDALRALLEALLVVVPAGVVVSTFLRLNVAPRAFGAAVAIGLLMAAVVVISVVPFLAFLVVVANAQLPALLAPAITLPALALIAVAVSVVRVIRALDQTDRARYMAIGFVMFLAATFVVRVGPHVDQLLGASTI